jgi:hypothetical protein
MMDDHFNDQIDDQNEDENEYQKTDRRRVLAIALVILLVIGAAGTIFYFLVLKKPTAAVEPTAPNSIEAVKPAAPESPALSAGEAPLVLPAVGLDQSDPVVREHALGLSANARFGQWLQSKDLVRKFVVAVDNVANGQSPKSHIDFFSPTGAFKALFKPDGTVLDPASFDRYNPVAEVMTSLDTASSVRLYQALKPLIQDAYRDLGYPGANFDDTLIKAIGELLETPIVEGPVRLEKKVLSFGMTDPALEALSAAQKLLLRMGPKNVRAIQAKLRDIARALGAPESRLPQERVYKPSSR